LYSYVFNFASKISISSVIFHNGSADLEHFLNTQTFTPYNLTMLKPEIKERFTFLFLSRFYVFNVFILSSFLLYKNVHWKFHQEFPEALLKP